MAELLYRLGRGASRRAKTTIAAWLVVMVVVGVAYALGAGTLSNSITIPGTPTQEVSDRLAGELPAASGGTGRIVFSTTDDAEITDAQQAALAEVMATASELDGVEEVVDPFATEAERAEQAQAVEDGRTQIAEGRDQLSAARDQIEDGRAQLDQARAEAEAGQEQIDAARAQAEAAGMLAQAEPQLDAQQEALDEGLAQIEAQEAELEAGAAELEKQSAELETQAAQLEMGAPLLEMAAEIRMVSEDGTTAVATILFTDSLMDIPQETKDAVVNLFETTPVDGIDVTFSSEITQAIPAIFGAAEAIGLVVAAIVLVVMLGTLIGAGLPIITALVGVGVAALGAMSLSGAIDMISVTPVLGLMLGLAVGIDYALFIVNRHRRQLKAGFDVEESIGLANGTSGNAVVFAGTTVIIALLGLNVTGIPFLALMGTVGAACVAVAVLVAVTLTPAILSLVGMRILSRKERADRGPEAQAKERAAQTALKPMKTSSAVVRLVVGVVGLLVVAVPALDLRLNLPDGSSEPRESSQYQAYTTISEKFGEGQNGTLVVVADLPGSPSEEDLAAAQLSVAQELFAQDDVVAVAPIGASEDRTVTAFQVVPAEGPTSESTEELVHTLRDLSPEGVEGDLGVAGSASGNIDVSEKLANALPLYLAVVVGLSLIILIIVFRSIFVPVVATLGFILSYFAALGGVVAIYQWGWLSTLFGVESPGPVLSFLPTILVGVLFGLAMDYMLFLGSGMREAYAHGAPARLAVVQGFHAGRSVVTAAAIIMISVFGGFVFSHSAMIRPIGFALAFGVLVDAFVVRMLLIPALMHLAGDKAWWLPRWLDKLLPDVDVEGAKLERSHPHVELDEASKAPTA